MGKPSNLLARAKTWSSYNHHHTAKFLIGITPQGSVGWLVVLGLKGPLRQYFSLYQAVSQGEGERREK